MVRTAVWSDTYEQNPPAATQLNMERATARLLWPISETWFAFTVAGVALLLAVILLGAMLISSNRRAAVLENVAHAYAVDYLANAEEAGLATCPHETLIILEPLAAVSFEAGTIVDIIGQAAVAGANRYVVELRPLRANDWIELNSFRRAVRAGLLARWDTSSFLDGQYQLRLQALNRDNLPVSSSAHCTIVLELS